MRKKGFKHSEKTKLKISKAKKIPIKKGQQFGKLTIIKEVEPDICPCGQKTRKVLCQCKCGNIKEIKYQSLKRKITKSCGCLEGNLKHRMRKTRFYRTWNGLKSRCNNKNNKAYKYYGGRGIKCEWKSFEEFKNDMYQSYLIHRKNNDYTSIDRVDNNENYCKKNCKWATQKEQANNKKIII